MAQVLQTLIFAMLSTAVSTEEQRVRILTPLRVREIPDRFHGFEKYFDKYVPVLPSDLLGSRGVQVVATNGVLDSKVERVANVLAEFLDNDEDGELDNAKVAASMRQRGATMIMFKDQDEMEASGLDQIPGFDMQDCEGAETGSNRTLHAHVMTAGPSHACRHKPELICDAPLEEVLHLVTDTGFGPAYPKYFSTTAGSAMTISMDAMIGTCGFATRENPFGKHTHFRFPHCSGKYHYDDDTCDYNCLATEYIHHFVASYNGEYPWGRDDVPCPGSQGPRADEWELCADAPDGDLEPSRKLLREGDPDFFALLTDPSFRVPLRMPRGSYEPPRGQDSDNLQEVADARQALPITAFGRITLQGHLRRAHRSRAAARASAAAASVLV